MAKLGYPNRNGMVQYLAVSSHTLGPAYSSVCVCNGTTIKETFK